MKDITKDFWNAAISNPNIKVQEKKEKILIIINNHLFKYVRISESSNDKYGKKFIEFRNMILEDLNHKGRRKNYAAVILTIDGVTYTYYAVSGKNQRDFIKHKEGKDSLSEFRTPLSIMEFKNISTIVESLDNLRHYHACKCNINDHVRDYDTEKLLLELIYEKHKSEIDNSKHSELHLYTKYECCNSCKSVVVQWLLDFPNTKVNIYYSEEKYSKNNSAN